MDRYVGLTVADYNHLRFILRELKIFCSNLRQRGANVTTLYMGMLSGEGIRVMIIMTRQCERRMEEQRQQEEEMIEVFGEMDLQDRTADVQGHPADVEPQDGQDPMDTST